MAIDRSIMIRLLLQVPQLTSHLLFKTQEAERCKFRTSTARTRSLLRMIERWSLIIAEVVFYLMDLSPAKHCLREIYMTHQEIGYDNHRSVQLLPWLIGTTVGIDDDWPVTQSSTRMYRQGTHRGNSIITGDKHNSTVRVGKTKDWWISLMLNQTCRSHLNSSDQRKKDRTRKTITTLRFIQRTSTKNL